MQKAQYCAQRQPVREYASLQAFFKLLGQALHQENGQQDQADSGFPGFGRDAQRRKFQPRAGEHWRAGGNREELRRFDSLSMIFNQITFAIPIACYPDCLSAPSQQLTKLSHVPLLPSPLPKPPTNAGKHMGRVDGIWKFDYNCKYTHSGNYQL